MYVVCFLWVFAYLVINLSNCQLTSPNEQTADTFALGYVQLFYLSLKAPELYLKCSIFVKNKNVNTLFCTFFNNYEERNQFIYFLFFLSLFVFC